MKRSLLLLVSLIIIASHLWADNSPLCFTARNGSVTMRFDIKNVTHTIQYSTDSVNWVSYTSNTNVNLSANQRVFFRASTNQTTATAFGGANDYSGSTSSRFYFTSSNGGTVEGSGNIMSLYGPDCPALPLQANAFAYMFIYCETLTTAPELPATSLASKCYYRMFADCKALTTAPELPATVMANNCYNDMFITCESLIATPELPATTLASSCYYAMFAGCIRLTALPDLPATTLANSCYSYMFWQCSSLVVNTTGPGTQWEISATTAPGALSSMFSSTGGTMNGTPSVNTTYYVASDTTPVQPTGNPLCFTARNGSVTVRFDIKNVTHTIQYSTDSVNWVNYTSNTNVNLGANQRVFFRAATNQTTATAFGGAYDYDGSTSSRFYFTSPNGGTVEGSGNIMSLYGPDCPNLPLQPDAFAYMFIYCDSLTTAPELPATTLASKCYYRMFAGCKALTIAPELPATVMENNCYNDMFITCESLVVLPELPATTLASGCYSAMFAGCIKLTTLPDLPATTLESGCYSYMFWKCSSLVVNTAGPGRQWEISATTTAYSALTSMFLLTGGTMNGTPSVNTTYYIATRQYTVTANANNSTMGNVTGGGVYNYGDTVTLTATPNSGYEFISWSNGATTNKLTFVVVSDTTLTATFAPITGVERTSQSECVAYSQGLTIFLHGAESNPVRIFDMTGKLVAFIEDAENDCSFNVPMAGAYIIKIGDDEVIRVMVK